MKPKRKEKIWSKRDHRNDIMKKHHIRLTLFLTMIIVLGIAVGCSKQEEVFTYSGGIDSDGFYNGVTALDHVTLPTYEGLVIPKERYAVSEEALQRRIDAIMANFLSEDGVPELTDEFVRENLFPSFGYRSVAEMKAALQNNEQSALLFEYVKEYMVENTIVATIPESLLEYQKNTLIQSYQDAADFYEMKLEDFLRVYVRIGSVERLLEQSHDELNATATFSLVIQAIAEDADITVTDEDVAAYFEKHMQGEDYTEYIESHGLPYLRYITLQQKIVDHLVSSAVLE